MGFSDGVGESIRMHNGTYHLHAYSGVIMVPICLRIPDQVALQPGLQQRSPDFHDSCREESICKRLISCHFLFFLLFRLQIEISVSQSSLKL